MQKIDALRWTPHMDECLRILSANPDCPNDETLVQQVRLQLIVEKVGHWQEGATENGTESAKAPPSFFLQALKSQVQEVSTQTSFHSQSNGTLIQIPSFMFQSDATVEVLLAHLHSTSLAIHETAFSTISIVTNDYNFQQLEYLHSYLKSLRFWFDVFFTISPGDYIGLPFSIFSQLSHCLIALYRLSSQDDPSWLKAETRKTADILTILDMVIHNLAQASAVAGFDSSNMGEDVFDGTAKRLKSIRVRWEAKLDTYTFMATGAAGPTIDTTLPYDFPAEFPESEWGANDWLTDILMSMRT